MAPRTSKRLQERAPDNPREALNNPQRRGQAFDQAASNAHRTLKRVKERILLFFPAPPRSPRVTHNLLSGPAPRPTTLATPRGGRSGHMPNWSKAGSSRSSWAGSVGGREEQPSGCPVCGDALAHRWGGAPPCLTSSDLTSLEGSVPGVGGEAEGVVGVMVAAILEQDMYTPNPVTLHHTPKTLNSEPQTFKPSIQP